MPPNVRLIRAVRRPGGRGPGNGQFALQRALAATGPEWLKIGGTLQSGEIAWFWCWLDRAAAAVCAATGRPLIVGPNILFQSSRNPCAVAEERELCHSATCRLWFTESTWYARLIASCLGSQNRGPIVLWPYPIEPQPPGPIKASYDLLIYAKSGYRRSLVARLRRAFPRSKLIQYGRFQREALWAAARRAQACVYLSDDDRGPLALAEILLCGCPTVGVERGAPFVDDGKTGIRIEHVAFEPIVEAVEQCRTLDRRRVTELAATKFDSKRIVHTIVEALDQARRAERHPMQERAAKSAC